MFTDAVASRSEAGERVLLRARRRRLSAGSLRGNKQEPAVRRLPATRSREGESPPAAAKGNLMGRPRRSQGSPARPPSSGKGRGRCVPAAGAGGQSGSERGWAPGLAGAPGFLGAGPLPLRRDTASSFPPASTRPGPGALSLHLSWRTGGCGGASREGAAPGGHLPWPRPSARRRRVPAAPPGRPRALGLTRLSYGAGEVGAGSLRGPSGALLAGSGAGSPRGAWGAGRGGVRT